MKLKKKNGLCEPRYPLFEEYQKNRDTYLRGLSLGAGVLLASGAMVFAGDKTAEQNSPRRSDSDKPAVEEPVRLMGDIATAANPVEKTPGETETKKKKEEAEPIRVRGKMVAPRPKGEPPPPKPPKEGEKDEPADKDKTGADNSAEKADSADKGEGKLPLEKQPPQVLGLMKAPDRVEPGDDK